MGTAAETGLCKLGWGTSDPVDTPLNFLDFDIGVKKEFKDTNASKGTFNKDPNRVVVVKHIVKPKLSLEPTAAELGPLIAWAMNGTPTGSTTKTYPLGDTPAKNNIHFAPRVPAGEQWFLGGVAVQEMRLSCSIGEPLKAEFDFLGQTFDDTRSSYPSLTLDQTTRPFVLAELVASIGGSSRNVKDMMFSINNGLLEDRFFNSLTLTDAVKADQTLKMGFTVPSGANAGAWTLGTGNVSVTATFTNAGGSVLVISTSAFKPEPTSPTFAQKDEGLVRLEGELYRITTGSPVTITLTL